jgi:hypothetical protein
LGALATRAQPFVWFFSAGFGLSRANKTWTITDSTRYSFLDVYRDGFWLVIVRPESSGHKPPIPGASVQHWG